MRRPAPGCGGRRATEAPASARRGRRGPGGRAGRDGVGAHAARAGLDGSETVAGAIAGGRASALFAVLAGVGVALATGGAGHPPGSPRPATSAPRSYAGAASGLLVRGALVALVGFALVELDSPVAVILRLLRPAVRGRDAAVAAARAGAGRAGRGVVRPRAGREPCAARGPAGAAGRPTGVRRARRAGRPAAGAGPDRLLPGAAVGDLPARRDGGGPDGPALDPGRGVAARAGVRRSRWSRRRGRRCCSARAAARRRSARSSRSAATARSRPTPGGGWRWRHRTPVRRSTSRTPRGRRWPCWVPRCWWPGSRRAVTWPLAAVGALPLTLYTVHVTALALYPAEAAEASGVSAGTLLVVHLVAALVIGGTLCAARAARAAGGRHRRRVRGRPTSDRRAPGTAGAVTGRTRIAGRNRLAINSRRGPMAGPFRPCRPGPGRRAVPAGPRDRGAELICAPRHRRRWP